MANETPVQGAMRRVDAGKDFSDEEIIAAGLRNVAQVRLQQLGRALWTASDEKVIRGMTRLLMALQPQAHAEDEVHKEPIVLPKAVLSSIDKLNETEAAA